MNHTLTRILVCCIALVYLSTDGIGQIIPDGCLTRAPTLGTIINDPDFNLEPEHLWVGEDCSVEVEFNLLLANLESTGTNIYVLPSNLDPMGLRIEIGGQTYCYELREFYNLCDNIYYSRTRVSVNVSTQCGLLGDDTLPWKVEVVKYSANQSCEDQELYELCNHTGVNDIYDCAIFDVDCPTETPYECEDIDLGTFTDIIQLNCDGCERIDAPTYGNDVDRVIRNGQKSVDSAVQVAPNPVGETTRISWSMDKINPHQIEILDVNGRLLQVWTKENLQGKSAVLWEASMQSGGVYFVRIKHHEKLEVIELLKL
jgi:hypothetical protein